MSGFFTWLEQTGLARYMQTVAGRFAAVYPYLDKDDILQEGFLALWRLWKEGKKALGIARRKSTAAIIDFMRKERRHFVPGSTYKQQDGVYTLKWTEAASDSDGELSALEEIFPGHVDTPEDWVIVKSLLERMPARWRPLLAYRLAGWPLKDICSELGITYSQGLYMTRRLKQWLCRELQGA